MLTHRSAAAILLAPFAVLALEWSTREIPDVPCGHPPDPAWTSGVSAAAFVTGCICLAVALRISAREGRPGLPTRAAVAVWLVAAVTWWIGGESSPIAWWAAIAYVVQFPAVPFVLTILLAIVVRPSWTLVTLLAWLGAIVFVPGFVGVIEMAGYDFKC